jgi:hypothetical protein
MLHIYVQGVYACHVHKDETHYSHTCCISVWHRGILSMHVLYHVWTMDAMSASYVFHDLFLTPVAGSLCPRVAFCTPILIPSALWLL